MELHRFDAFLRFKANVQLQVEAAGKILGLSFTFGVRHAPWTALVLRVYNQAVKPKIDVKPLQRD